MSEKRTGTGFVFCEHCRTLFVGLSALEFLHVCGPRIGQSRGPDQVPAELERTRRAHPIQWAQAVVDHS